MLHASVRYALVSHTLSLSLSLFLFISDTFARHAGSTVTETHIASAVWSSPGCWAGYRAHPPNATHSADCLPVVVVPVSFIWLLSAGETAARTRQTNELKAEEEEGSVEEHLIENHKYSCC